MSKIKDGLKRYFYISEGGKERINFAKIGQVFLFIFALVFVITAFIPSSVQKGFSEKTDKSLINHQEKQASSKNPDNKEAFQTAKIQEEKKGPPRKVKKLSTRPIEFNAQQVIARASNDLAQIALPTGTNMIGKLLTAVDTRNLLSMTKVLLPYGARFQGREFLAKGTVLIGKGSYSGKGERVLLKFNKAISPQGKESNISAHALDTSDYANGVIGEVHSETGMRVAGVLGLTMISGMADVLTEKTAHGESGVITTKSTMRNALTHGVAKVAEMEAGRQAQALAQTPPYVTLEAGKDVIITLTQTFKEN